MTIKTLGVNNDGRDFVCGDIHGSFSCVQRFLDHVKFDPARDRLIAVGDLIDRGPENEKCLELLYEQWFFSVKGNHEQLMEEYFYDEQNYHNWWFANGGHWGSNYKRDISDLAMMVKDCLETKIKSLPLLITVNTQAGKKFHVIHAEFYAPGHKITDETLSVPESFSAITEIETEDGQCVIWGRFLFGDFYKKTVDDREISKAQRRNELRKTGLFFNDKLSHIYSGHTIVKKPIQFLGQTNLDTMAYGSYKIDPPEWCGLTFTEPLTDRFWLSNDREVKDTQPVIIS